MDACHRNPKRRHRTLDLDLAWRYQSEHGRSERRHTCHRLAYFRFAVSAIAGRHRVAYLANRNPRSQEFGSAHKFSIWFGCTRSAPPEYLLLMAPWCSDLCFLFFLLVHQRGVRQWRPAPTEGGVGSGLSPRLCGGSRFRSNRVCPPPMVLQPFCSCQSFAPIRNRHQPLVQPPPASLPHESPNRSQWYSATRCGDAKPSDERILPPEKY